MAYSITRRDLAFAHDAATRAISHAGRLRRRGESVTEQLVQTTLVSASTFGFSFLAGYAGNVDVLGVPIDLGAGFLFQIGAFAGIGGQWSKGLHDLGDGAFAAYFAKLGASVGDRVRRQGGRRIGHPAFPSSSGDRGMMSGGERRTMTENELAAMAMASRS
jgi:hypothetical protein